MYGYLMEKTFENRGYSDEFLSSIEAGSQNPMKDADLLCAKLNEIRKQNLRITMLSDFDMDGICAGVIGYAGLAELGFNVSLFIPDPTDGYGFTPRTIGKLMAAYPDTQAILTGDVGVTCFDGVSAARSFGVRMLVTDHHNPEYEEQDEGIAVLLPSAEAVVDPMRLDDGYEHGEVCGAYVLWYCLYQYANLYGDRYMQEQIRRLKVFAGIGTVSDSMPMLYENRETVRDAVGILRMLYSENSDFVVNHITGHDVYRRAFYGLYQTLSYLAGVGTIQSGSDIDEDLLGYYLAPMFNSVKRMGGDMSRAFGVFFGANSLDDVAYLYELNEQRKNEVKKKLAQLQAVDQPYQPYVWFSDAIPGVLGLLAQHMRELTGLPCLVVNPDNNYSGSGRCPDWYNFLSRTKSISIYAAGHEQAFGVSLSDEATVQTLCGFLEQDVEQLRSEGELQEAVYHPDFVIDPHGSGDIKLDILSFLEYLSELRRYHPFGNGFQKPDILLYVYPKESVIERIGSAKQHLKIRMAHGFEVLLWNQAQLFDDFRSAELVRIRGSLSLSQFMDRYTVTFTGTVVSAEDEAC